MFHKEKWPISSKNCHFKLKTYKLTGFSTKFPLNSRKILKTQEKTQNPKKKLIFPASLKPLIICEAHKKVSAVCTLF